MIDKIYNIFFTIAVGLISSVSAFNLQAGEYNAILSIGDSLPSFEKLPATSGEKFSSSDFNADVVVMVSLSNTCPFSNGIEKDLIALVDAYKKQSVSFVAVNYNMTKADSMAAMKTRGENFDYNFVYLKDSSQQLGRQLGTTVTPEFFVFNKERKLIYMGLLHNSPAMMQGKNPVYLKGDPSIFYVQEAIDYVLNKTSQEDISFTQETRPYGCSVEYTSPLE